MAKPRNPYQEYPSILKEVLILKEYEAETEAYIRWNYLGYDEQEASLKESAELNHQRRLEQKELTGRFSPYRILEEVDDNLFSITDQDHLETIVPLFCALRADELKEKPMEGNFDLAHLQAIHKYLFQDIYPWAGEVCQDHWNHWPERDSVTPASVIEAAAPAVLSKLAPDGPLAKLRSEQLSQELAGFMRDLQQLKPFYRGSAIAQFAFVEQWARHHHYQIDWDNFNLNKFAEGEHREEKCPDIPLIDLDYHLALQKSKEWGDEFVHIESAAVNQSYAGPIIAVTHRYVAQALDLAPCKVVIHERHALSKEVKVVPHQRVEINYPYNKDGIVHEDSHYQLTLPLFKQESLGQPLHHQQVTYPEPGKSYGGKIIGVTQHYVLQALEDPLSERPSNRPFHVSLKPKVMVHDRAYLSGSLEVSPSKNVEISYPCGKVGLVRSYAPELSFQPQHHKTPHKTAERQQESYNYERG